MKNKKLSKFALTNIQCYGMIAVAAIVVFILQAFGLISNSLNGLLVPICAYIVMAISLNLTVGFLGELSLGHAGFMSVGAFGGAIVAMFLKGSVASDPLRLVLAIIIGGILAGIVGIIVGVPVLRLRGDYLAIVTLAFGEIIKNIINCVYVGFDANGLRFSMTNEEALGLVDGTMILKGPSGAVGIDKISTFIAGILLILFTLVIVLNLANSKTGRAVTAIRDNRIAAESVGINITKYKMTAFVISAALAGMAGALYAMNFSSIKASKFDFNTSILVLVFVVLGGMGNIPGTIIATTLLYMLPEVLREFSNYRMLIYAIVLIVVMVARNSEKVKAFTEKIKFKLKKQAKTGEGGALNE